MKTKHFSAGSVASMAEPDLSVRRTQDPEPVAGRAGWAQGDERCANQPARRSGSTLLPPSRKFRSLGLVALLALFAGCETDGDYSGSGSVNFYGGVGYYNGFYDPWYGHGGGGAIIVSPPGNISNRPTVTPHAGGGGRRR